MLETIEIKTNDSSNNGALEVLTPQALKVRLSSELVDLSQPVQVIVNGVEKFNGSATTDLNQMIEDARLLKDHSYLYEASLQVSL